MFDSMARKFTKRKPPRVRRGRSGEDKKVISAERRRIQYEWIRWNQMVDRIDQLRDFVGIPRTRETGDEERRMLEYFEAWHKYGDLSSDPTPCRTFKPWDDQPEPDAGASAIVV